MKKHLSSILFLFLYTPTFPQSENQFPFFNTWESMSLKDSVSSIIETYNYAKEKSGKIKKGKKCSGLENFKYQSEYYFNKIGQITSERNWDPQYKKGNEEEVFEYKNNRLFIHNTIIDKDTLTREFYHYKNEKILKTESFFKGKIYEIEEYKYSVTNDTIYEYTLKNDTVTNFSELNWSNGNLLRLSMYSVKDSMMYFSAQMDLIYENNQIIKRTDSIVSIAHDKPLLNYERYEYDEFGNIILLASNSGTNSYKYEYDKSNNWVTRIEFRDEKPILITTRKIVYY